MTAEFEEISHGWKVETADSVSFAALQDVNHD